MSKKNRTQMTPELTKRIGEAKREARDWLVKNEIVQFRLDQESYRSLFLIAERERKPIGTLVREWISEKVKQDILVKKPVSNTAEVATVEQVVALQKQINELKKQVTGRVRSYRSAG